MTTQHRETVTRQHDRKIDTPHGQVYASEIPGDDPPIVLMHGFPDDHRIYDHLTPRLSPRRAVAFDFVGYGRSDRPERTNFSSQAHSNQITAVFDTLHADRAVLVGHDASGPDAIAYSVAHPQRIAHLVLLNTVFGNQPSLIMPEMTRLFSDPQLKALADDMAPTSCYGYYNAGAPSSNSTPTTPMESSGTPSCPNSTGTSTKPTPSRPYDPGVRS